MDPFQRLEHAYWIVDKTNPDGTFKYVKTGLIQHTTYNIQHTTYNTVIAKTIIICRDGMVYFQSDESTKSLTMHMNRQNTRMYICSEDTRPESYHTIQSLSKDKVRIFYHSSQH